MATSNSTLQEVISPKVPEQFAGLHKDLIKSKELLVDNILAAEKLDSVLSKATNFKSLNEAQIQVNKTTQQTIILNQKVQEGELKIEELKKKNAFNDEKRENARKAREEKQIADDNARLVREAKKGKVILTNSQEELDAYNNTVNGSKKVTSTLSLNDKAYAQAANSATSYVGAQKKVVEATLKVSPAAIAAQKSINSLKIQLASYETIAANATDPKIISEFNAKAQETEITINRLGNVGKKGFDEFGNAIEKNKSKLSGVWNGLKSVANILPGVGIAGLLAFAVEPVLDYIKSLDLLGTKLSQTAKIKKIIDDASLEGAKNSAQETTQLKVLYGITQDTTISLKQRKEAVDELQKQFPTTFKNIKDETILNGGAKEAYDELTLSIVATARARAYSDKITENSKRRFENDKAIAEAEIEYNKARVEQRKAVDKAYGAETNNTNDLATLRNTQQISQADNKRAEYARDIRERKKDNLLIDQQDLKLQEAINAQVKNGANLTTKPEKEAKVKAAKIDTSEQDGQANRIKALRDSSKAVLENDKETFELRIQALELFENSSKEIADLNYEAGVKKAKGNNDKIIALQAELRTEYNRVEIESGKQLVKINDDAQKQIIASLTKDEQAQVAAIQEANNKKLSEIESYRSQAIQGLTDQFAEGKITEEQYNQQLYDIEAQASEDRIQLKIDELQKIIGLEESFLAFNIGSDKKVADDKAALAAKEIELSALKTKAQIDDAKKLAEAKKDLHNQEEQLVNELASLGNAIIRGVFTSQINAIKEQMDYADKKKAQEIENVNSSVLSEEDKANKITIINARAAAQEELLAQKQKDIQLKQAKFEKAINIGKALSSVALAEIQALTYLSNPITAPLYPAIAATIAAIGAAQIATILATKIEAFEHGGTKKGDGLALFGEVGTELMIDPSGKLGLTPATPTVGYVKSGTEFISNRDLVRMLAAPEPSINVKGNSFDLSPLIMEERQSRKEIKLAIKGIKTGSGPSKYGWYNTQKGINDLQNYKRNSL